MKLLYTLILALSLSACGGGNYETESPTKTQSVAAMSAPPAAPIKIVTIGDSETAGAVSTPTGFTNIPEASYPARLQGLLGSKAVVTNLGVNSTNLLEVYTDQFNIARTMAPDILIVSTTLNDAGDMMEKDLLYLIWWIFKRDLPNTRIILLTPLKAHVSISPTVLQDYTTNLYRATNLNIGTSETYHMEVFDVGAYDTPDWYCGHQDFHPCEYGYREMARYVYNYLNIN